MDVTQTNVALFKPTTSSLATGSYTDPLLNNNVSVVYTPAMGVNGVIDADNAFGDMVNFPCDGTGWWRVDLGECVCVYCGDWAFYCLCV